jgi:uncharacterized protein YggU (UPF0235/DUF167 family)
VRVTPNAGRDAVEDVETGADGKSYLRLRVRAVPDKGAANRAVVALLAKHVGVAKSAVTLLSGETLRQKILRIEGDPEDLIARLGVPSKR